jgi:hypothetical protein
VVGLAWALLLAFGLAATGQGSDPPPINLSGTWAEVETYSGFLSSPLFERIPGVLAVILRVEIVQVGCTLVLTNHYCTFRIESGVPIGEIEVPAAFLASLHGAERKATLVGTGEGVRFVQPWHTQVNGARLAHPETEPLPTRPDDPRVIDEDGDGHPGVTLLARLPGVIEVALYLVLRLRYRLAGTVVSPDRIEGLIEWSGDLVLLGASLPLPGMSRDAYPHPEPTRSRFVLQRIASTCDCAAVMASWDELVKD